MKAQYELYTDEELVSGAERWGITVQQERQRLYLLQTTFQNWPSILLRRLKMHNANLVFITFAVIQNIVVTWLKEGNNIVVPNESEFIVV